MQSRRRRSGRLLPAASAKPATATAGADTAPRTPPTPRLSDAEQQAILDVLHSDRFSDLAPAEVWAILLDEGIYLGSESTFYRLLRKAGEVRERRRQVTARGAVLKLARAKVNGQPLLTCVDGTPDGTAPAWRVASNAVEHLVGLDREAGYTRRLPTRPEIARTYARFRGRISSTELGSLVGASGTNVGSVLKDLSAEGVLTPSNSTGRGRGLPLDGPSLRRSVGGVESGVHAQRDPPWRCPPHRNTSRNRPIAISSPLVSVADRTGLRFR